MTAKFLFKVLVSALVIAGASELSKRSPTSGAILASLPLTTILALIWLYVETRNVAAVSEFSVGVFWAVLPSFLFLLSLPLLLKMGVRFAPALVVSMALMAGGYAGYVWILRKFGVEI